MTRVLTALALIPAVWLLVFWAPAPAVSIALAATALLCLREFFALSRGAGFAPFEVAGYGAGLILILAPNLPEPAFLVIVCLLLIVLAVYSVSRTGGAYAATASTLFGVIYVCGPFAIARDLHAASPHWLFFVLVVAWTGDTAAYFVGRAIGRHKLAPSMSPGKTWEGTIASVVAAILAGVFYWHHHLRFVDAGIAAAVCLSLSVNVAGQIGDLAESALKRSAGVKDSGSLLPGHGGALDRMDNFLFAVPAAYLWLLWLS